MPEEVKEAVAEEQQSPQEVITDLIKNVSGPSTAEIEKFKAAHGDVFVYAFSDTELYIFRALKRNEFRDLQTQLMDPKNNMDQLTYEEAICSKCVLWPAVDKDHFAKSKGGTATSLAEQIMMNSNFTGPQSVALVAKL